MTTTKMSRKAFVARLEEVGIYASKVVAHNDGSFEFRNGYFYHNPGSDERRLVQAQAAFPEATVKQEDCFNRWPKDSWIATIIKFPA